MASLYRHTSYGSQENTANNSQNNNNNNNNNNSNSNSNSNSTAFSTGNSMADMNQNYHNYPNMNMPPAPLPNMNMNMSMSKVPSMGGMNSMNSMNSMNNRSMGVMGVPMGYSNQGYPVSGGMNLGTGVGVGVGIPVSAANYTRQHFPPSNNVGLASQLSYGEKDGFDSRIPSGGITSNTQTKSPLSPQLYQQNNTNRSSGYNSNGITIGVSKGSVAYPPTPQTLHSQQGQYPLTPPAYDSQIGGAGVNYRETSRLRGLADEDSEGYGDHVSGSSNTGDESRELYYEMSSKTYVPKTREEGREGLRTGALVKVDAEHENGDSSGSRKKKLTGSGNESDDDDDDDGRDDESRNPEKREASGNRSRNKRSRGGCLTCRQRKKRCCESKPVCSECRRLNIKCRWPVPGSERKNKSKNQPHMSHDEVYHEVYGVIKVLRGVVDYKIEP